MRGILLSILFFLLVCTATVRAQYDAQFSQYFMAMGYYNPAYAGTSEDLNVFGLHRQQWVGIDNAPKSFFVMADMPFRFLETNHGVGLVVFTESIGLFNLTHVSGQYAYKKNIFGGTLSIGLQIGMANQSFQGDSVRLLGPDQAVEIEGFIPRTQVSGMAMDMNAGIFYSHKKFYVGVGATHFLEPEVKLDENSSIYIPRAFNLTAGYNIQTSNPLYELQPSVFLKTDMISFQADITARMVYNKMFNGGLSWRVNESVVFMLGATFGRFQVGYAYDFPYSPILKESSGSHELMIKYSMKLNKMKRGKNRHKSVRIL